MPTDGSGEREILIKAVRVNTLSKLTYSDTRQFLALIGDVFPGAESSDIPGVRAGTPGCHCFGFSAALPKVHKFTVAWYGGPLWTCVLPLLTPVFHPCLSVGCVSLKRVSWRRLSVGL